jgi:pilus assembly protein CpaE
MLAFVVNEGQPDRRVVLLEQVLEKLGYVIARKDSIVALVNDPQLKANKDSLVLIPVAEGSGVKIEEVMGLAYQLRNNNFVIYVADDISQSDYKALIRTGAADCAGWDSAKGEIIEICQRRRPGGRGATPAGGPDGPSHTVITFLGTSGGAGNTTAALETGVYIASANGKDARRVAIVDLNIQRSVMCDYLNLPPRLDMADLMRNPQRLDKYMLEIFTSKHASGLDLLACENNDVDYSALNPGAVFSLLDHLNELYDIVLLDAPCCRTSWLDRILTNSDFVFVTGRYSVPSVKQIAYELKCLRELSLGPENLGVIINWCQKSFFGSVVRKSDIDGTLAGQRIFYVQQDVPFALECVNLGTSMIQRGSLHGICRDIKKIGESVLCVKPRVAS